MKSIFYRFSFISLLIFLGGALFAVLDLKQAVQKIDREQIERLKNNQTKLSNALFNLPVHPEPLLEAPLVSCAVGIWTNLSDPDSIPIYILRDGRVFHRLGNAWSFQFHVSTFQSYIRFSYSETEVHNCQYQCKQTGQMEIYFEDDTTMLLERISNIPIERNFYD